MRCTASSPDASAEHLPSNGVCYPVEACGEISTPWCEDYCDAQGRACVAASENVSADQDERSRSHALPARPLGYLGLGVGVAVTITGMLKKRGSLRLANAPVPAGWTKVNSRTDSYFDTKTGDVFSYEGMLAREARKTSGEKLPPVSPPVTAREWYEHYEHYDKSASGARARHAMRIEKDMEAAEKAALAAPAANLTEQEDIHRTVSFGAVASDG